MADVFLSIGLQAIHLLDIPLGLSNVHPHRRVVAYLDRNQRGKETPLEQVRNVLDWMSWIGGLSFFLCMYVALVSVIGKSLKEKE